MSSATESDAGRASRLRRACDDELDKVSASLRRMIASRPDADFARPQGYLEMCHLELLLLDRRRRLVDARARRRG